MSTSREPQCDVALCGEPAKHTIEAQWSLFDWLDVHCCDPHWKSVWDQLAQHRVDGELPYKIETIHSW